MKSFVQYLYESLSSDANGIVADDVALGDVITSGGIENGIIKNNSIVEFPGRDKRPDGEKFKFKVTTNGGKRVLLVLRPQSSNMGRTWIFPNKKQNGVEGLVSSLMNMDQKQILDYIQHATHENLEKIQERFSRRDVKFSNEYDNLVKDGRIVVNRKDKSVVFKMIGQTAKNISEDTVEKLKAACREFDRKVGLDEGSSEYISILDDDGGSDGLGESMDAKNAEKTGNDGERWSESEKQVLKGINGQVNEFLKGIDRGPETPGVFAHVVGASYQSDVIVTTNQEFDKENAKSMNFKPSESEFFVEVKKNYDDAKYLRFNFTFDNGRFVKVGEIEQDELGEILTDLVSRKGGTVHKKFTQLQENVKTCVEILKDVTKHNNRFKAVVKLDNADLDKFPGAFDPLAQAFNFFVVEWSRKFFMMRQRYVYDFCLEGKADDDIVSIAQNVKKRLDRLGNVEQFAKMDTFSKFKTMYRNLVSTDKSLKNDDEFNSTLFSISSAERDKEGVELNRRILGFIRKYYAETKGARYIQIGEDLYTFEVDDREKFDPFGINGGTLEFNDSNLDTILKITLETALLLHLELRLEKHNERSSKMSLRADSSRKFRINPKSAFAQELERIYNNGKGGRKT